MAAQTAHDVVKQAQSMGDSSPTDVSATFTSSVPAGNGQVITDSASTLPKPLYDPSTPTPAATSLHAPSTNGIIDVEAEDQTDAVTNELQLDDENEFEFQTPAWSDTKENLTNGISDEVGQEEVLLQNAATDAGVGSDTDISRTGSADPMGDGSNQRVRSNSVKRPISFRTVSVTKNFLAKSTAGTPVSKAGEKVATTGPPGSTPPISAKPRLVAKAGLRDAVPRSGSAGPNGAGNAIPDASKVWNKNRPVPPPPPKQFTDEELKQQYGIHLATRLQADEAGKEAKWADIDDDEDDWAPETVEWLDGTKSTIAQQPGLAEQQKPVSDKPQKPLDASRAILSIVQRPSAAAPGKTILKPGIYTAAAAEAKSAAEKAKTGSATPRVGAEKGPTLVAKSPAPPPVKSPWAPLPPIDKVPLVQINPPTQPEPAPRFGQPDPHGFDAMPPPPMPAKEIAADDFDRSWKDSDRGTRELFNSQSGRYEPVREPRRSSVRNDGGFRQPSVLQRPMYAAQHGPAEPSAAFQTSRSSADGTGWARRRTSSNVSAGEGHRIAAAQQDSKSPGRRDSQAVVDEESPTSNPSSWIQPAPRTTQDSQQGLPPSENVPEGPAAAPTEDPVAMQKRLMRERREAAMKRRKEEEEREEAERRERIRIKMESLGMLPVDKNERDAETIPAAPVPQEEEQHDVGSGKTQHVEGEPEKVEDRPALQQQDAVPQQAKASKSQEELPVQEDKVSAQLQTKGPVPSSPNAVASGSANQPRSPDRALERTRSPLGSVNLEQGRTRKPTRAEATAGSPQEAVAKEPYVPSPTPAKGRTPRSGKPLSDADTAQKPPTQDNRLGILPESPSIERKQQAWQSPPIGDDVLPGWGATAMKAHSMPGSNVWGSPLHEKALGNGTFNNSYHGFQTRRSPYQQARQFTQPLPGPIAPPSVTSNISPPATQDPLDDGLAEEEQRLPIKPAAARSPQITQEIQLALMDSQATVTAPFNRRAPVAPPTTLSGRQAQNVAPFGLATWKNFPAQLVREEAAERQLATQEYASRKEQEAQTGMKPATKLPVTETFRQTKPGAGLGHRHVVGTAAATYKVGQQPTDANVQAPALSSPHHPHPVVNLPQMVNGVSAGPKPSRFFGPHTRSRSPSPPPPESSSHPAYVGDWGSPRVNLPKPRAQVKLPPAPAPENVSPPAVTVPYTRSSFHGGARPLVMTEDWRARFEGLLGRPQPQTISPPKSQPPSVVTASVPPAGGVDKTQRSLPVDSASRTPLEHPGSSTPALVMLPKSEDRLTSFERPGSSSGNDDSGGVVSKPMVEPLLEEREFGSLPRVTLPPKPTQRPYSRPYRAIYRRYPLQINPFSIIALSLFDEPQAQPELTLTIKIPYSRRPPTTKTMCFSSMRNQSLLRNASNSYNNQRFNKPFGREHSGSQALQQMPQSSGDSQMTGQRRSPNPSGATSFFKQRSHPSPAQSTPCGDFGQLSTPANQRVGAESVHRQVQPMSGMPSANVHPRPQGIFSGRTAPRSNGLPLSQRSQESQNLQPRDKEQQRPPTTVAKGTPTSAEAQPQRKPSTPPVRPTTNFHLQQKSLQKGAGSLRSQATPQPNSAFSLNRFATLQHASSM